MIKESRVFIAVNIPNKVKEEISVLLESIQKEKYRIVKKENMHITLCFLGNISKRKIEELREGMQTLSSIEKFEIELNGIGHFNERVIWLGTGKGTEEINFLAKKTCESIDILSENFHSHITLARNKGARKEEVKELVEKLRENNFKKTVKITSIELMESILHKSGPEYKILFKIDLQNPL
jgi:2'-5' RNA ligase